MNTIEGRPDLTPIRITLSIILIVYCFLQIYVLLRKHISKLTVFSFPIIYSVFGLYWEYAITGFLKGWAPSTGTEALSQNILCFLFLTIIISMAVFTTLKGSRNVQSA